MIERIILPENPVRVAAAALDSRHPDHTETTQGLVAGFIENLRKRRISLETMDLADVPENEHAVEAPDTVDELLGYDLKDHHTSAVSFIETAALEIRNRYPHIFIQD